MSDGTPRASLPTMKVVYIAGKYRGPTPWAVEQNIIAARGVAARVWAAGHVALCPHTNAAHMEGAHTDEQVLAGTMELLRRCDAVLCVSNWRYSAGARAEVEEARRLGLPVFGIGTDTTVAIKKLCVWAAGTLAQYDKRKCNLHDDCDAADRKAQEDGKRIPHHCRTDDCEDCFGT